ncbi:MAG: motility protein A [Acetatifactor sp.]|nr:motility protein A [Acetatifactor sp.]
MDIASIVGLIMGFMMLVYGIISNHADLMTYLNFPSAIITFGGALFAVMLSYSMKDFLNGLKSIKLIFKSSSMNTAEMIKSIIDLSNVARKEGLLSLEEAAADLDEPFLKKGILLIVDGTDPDLVRAIMETELVSIEGRHKTVIGFWENLASMGPAWGMIGTLVGLVNMLNNMQDPSKIGGDMAVALITTLYGSVLANWLCTPVAGKLKTKNAEEMQLKEIMVEGLRSIQAGENPRVIEEKLKSFLAPKERVTEGGDEAGGEE